MLASGNLFPGDQRSPIKIFYFFNLPTSLANVLFLHVSDSISFISDNIEIEEIHLLDYINKRFVLVGACFSDEKYES